MKILFALLLSSVTFADSGSDSGLVVSCLDAIRNQYLPANEAFDSCAQQSSPTAKIECLHRLARPLSDKSQCTSNPGNQVPAIAVNGVSIDVPTAAEGSSVCQSIAEIGSRNACEREVTGRAFPQAEMGVCRTLPDNSQILRCLMAVQGGCFDDRVAVEICGSMVSASQPPPAMPPPPTVVYASPPPVVVQQPVYDTNQVYYSSPGMVVMPAPIWMRPVPRPWVWHHWRRF